MPLNRRLKTKRRLKSEKLVGISASAASLSFIIFWINSFYFAAPVSEILSFYVSDGHCSPAFPGVGAHCFGDYYAPILGLLQGSPWIVGFAYPPSATITIWPFVWILQISSSPTLTLYLFLLTALVCCLVPAIWLAKTTKLAMSVSVLLFGVLTTPVLSAVDRGNHIVFVIPVFVYIVHSLEAGKWRNVSLGIIAACTIKPQFALLAMIFIPEKRSKDFFTALSGGLLVHLVGFALTGAPIDTLKSWLRFIADYEVSQNMSALGGPNLSFAHGLRTFWSIVAESLFGMNTNTTGFSSLHFQNFTRIVVVLVLLSFLIHSSPRARAGNIVCLMAISSMATGVSWMYYQVFAVVALTMCVKGVFDQDFDRDLSNLKLNRYASTTLMFSCILSCYQLPISSDFGLKDFWGNSSISRVLIPVAWFVFIILIGLRNALSFQSGESKRLESTPVGRAESL